MSRERVRRAGAERRIEASPFGSAGRRAEWSQRIAGFTGLKQALAELLAWRNEHAAEPGTDQDGLWIEARLEEQVAMLRFAEKSNEEIRSRTLTGESIADVQTRFAQASKKATAGELETLASEFRRVFKPPVMPSSPYLRTEMILCEQLMKLRSLNWFEPSIKDLRVRRGVVVVKEGWPEAGINAI